MQKIKNKHYKFEQKMQQYITKPRHLNNEFEIKGLLADNKAAFDLFLFGFELRKWCEKAWANKEVKRAVWEYDGFYHNTAINWTKHWGHHSSKKVRRVVIGIEDMFKIELQESAPGVIELWTITVNPKQRGKGTGTLLMKTLMDIAQAYDMQLKLVACSQDAATYKDFFEKTFKLRQWYYDLGFEYDKSSAYLVW